VSIQVNSGLVSGLCAEMLTLRGRVKSASPKARDIGNDRTED
jgi:hypothetical protein